MLKAGCNFYTLGHLCRVCGPDTACWISWEDLNESARDSFFLRLFGTPHLGQFTKQYLKDLDSKIEYKAFDASDSPDFGSYESLERFAKLLDTYILGKQIKTLNS